MFPAWYGWMILAVGGLVVLGGAALVVYVVRGLVQYEQRRRARRARHLGLPAARVVR
jgi:hypothetical protein